MHAAVDTLGHLLALHLTPANEQDRARKWRFRPKPFRRPPASGGAGMRGAGGYSAEQPATATPKSEVYGWR